MKVTFNKASVLFMYIMIIIMPIICIILHEYPPAEFTYCWFGFWAIQAVITAKLRINKRHHDRNNSLMSELTKYINENNVDKVIEKYTGLEIKPKKEKKK